MRLIVTHRILVVGSITIRLDHIICVMTFSIDTDVSYIIIIIILFLSYCKTILKDVKKIMEKVIM